MARCSNCGAFTLLGDFPKGRKECQPCYKAKSAAYGAAYRAANKEKEAARHRREYLANRDAVLARQKAQRAALAGDDLTERSQWFHDYYMANRASILAAQADRRALDPEQNREYSRRYRQANPDKVAEHSRRYHARRRGADQVERGVTWRAVSARDGLSCTYCEIECDPNDGHHALARDGANRWVCGPTYPTVDHIVPVSLGGHHTMANAVLSCNRCNKRKGARPAA